MLDSHWKWTHVIWKTGAFVSCFDYASWCFLIEKQAKNKEIWTKKKSFDCWLADTQMTKDLAIALQLCLFDGVILQNELLQSKDISSH